MNPPPDANISTDAPRKRLIICCDGTWMNSDDGYKKGSKGAQLQIPSNVTRISRAFRRQCTDNTLQIIYYQNGVGTANRSLTEQIGGAFGQGISENIREVYSFICANYCDGDEIVLIGFSRGAFTARSVAGLIGGIGLLTREGLEYFYPILKDVENWCVKGYENQGDEFPEYPPMEKVWDERGKKWRNQKPVFGTATTGEEYAKSLLKNEFTRMNEGPFGQGQPIKIRAVAVWDTVGSLGVPDVAWLSALGVPQSTKEYHFYDTSLSPKIEYAFHALALDEHRPPFSPAVWERAGAEAGSSQYNNTTVLKQVWFPGAHSDIGGGYEDQQASDITLAWMADQLSSVGVEFKVDELVHLFRKGKAVYSEKRAQQTAGLAGKRNSFFGMAKFFASETPQEQATKLPWAAMPIYAPGRDRCWALGEINRPSSLLYKLAGSIDRKPGLYQRVDREDGLEMEGVYLEGTNELIHPSVRARLACLGLGPEDEEVWYPRSLENWRLVRKRDCKGKIPKREPLDAPTWPTQREKTETRVQELEYNLPKCREEDEWVWEYIGVEYPKITVMPEERTGFWERVLMGITVGLPEVDSYMFAERNPPVWPGLERPSSGTSTSS